MSHKIIPDNFASPQIAGRDRFSHIYRRFRSEFEYLSHPDPSQDTATSEAYVDNPIKDEELLNFKDASVDEIAFLVGATGAGKSKIISHHYGLIREGVNLEDGRYLHIPIKFDNSFVDTDGSLTVDQNVRLFIARRVANAWREIARASDVAWEYDELASFTDKNKPCLLEAMTGGGINAKSSITEKIERLESTKPLAFNLQLLKLIANKSGIKDITLILDDIETIHQKWDVKLSFISQMIKASMCLRNNPIDPDCGKRYTSKLLIAARPETFWHMRNSSDSSVNLPLNAFNPDRLPVVLDICPSLSKIFGSRLNALILNSEYKQETKQSKLNEAGRVIDYIATSVENVFSNTISPSHNLLFDLSNRDFRLTFQNFREILKNKTWFQARWSEFQGAFQIKPSDYAIDETSLLKTIAYGHSNFYKEASCEILPNIFYNFTESGYSLMTPYILMYMFNAEGSEASSDIYGRYGGEVDVNLFRCKISNIFLGRSSLDYFENSLSHAKNKGLIWISAADRGSGNGYVVSPRGRAIWHLLEHTSLLLEFYREDTFLPDDMKGCILTNSLDIEDGSRFISVIDFAEFVLDEESSIVDYVSKNMGMSWLRGFLGDKPASSHIFGGLTRSYGVLYRGRNSPVERVVTKYKIYKEKILALEERWNAE